MAKKTKLPKLPKDIEIKCHGIIHGASVAAGGAGAAGAQLPVADNAVITPIQIGMIIALAKVFDRNLTKEAAFAVLKGAGAAFIGRGISQVLIGWVPGVGNAINTATAAGLTEAIGWMSAAQFYDEWLKDGHSPNERPNSFSEDKEKQQEKSCESKQKYRDELCAKADEFIKGRKDAKGADNDEFNKLLSDMEYEFTGLAADDPFKRKYEELTECLNQK